jgi:phosphoserine aminotransferase
MLRSAPLHKPKNPLFCSGPCAKIPNWNPNLLKNAMISRSHRSPDGEAQINKMLEQTKRILEIPETHKIAMVPGSATGAITMAMWNFLGSRPLDIVAWDIFGHRWIEDVKTLKMEKPINAYTADWGEMPDMSKINPEHDFMFVWNATSTGSSIDNLSWYDYSEESGLTICDATSAAFCVSLPWNKLDVTCFSWQKGLGGEGAHGLIVLSPKAQKLLETYTPAWGVPYLLTLRTPQGKIRSNIFEGKTINTPSMLCLFDAIQAMEWAEKNGGLSFLTERCRKNAEIVKKWVEKNNSWTRFIAKDIKHLSLANACIQIIHQGQALSEEDITILTKKLKDLGVAFDIKGFKGVPGNIRIWTGPTIEVEDIKTLLEWIEWAYLETFKN